MNRYFLVAVATILAACETTSGDQSIMNSWMGAQEDDLVRSWGPPVQSYESGGRKFIVYESHRNIYLPGTAAGAGAIGGSPGMNVNLSCTTTFELNGSKVILWANKGNDCKTRKWTPFRG